MGGPPHGDAVGRGGQALLRPLGQSFSRRRGSTPPQRPAQETGPSDRPLHIVHVDCEGHVHGQPHLARFVAGVHDRIEAADLVALLRAQHAGVDGVFDFGSPVRHRKNSRPSQPERAEIGGRPCRKLLLQHGPVQVAQSIVRVPVQSVYLCGKVIQPPYQALVGSTERRKLLIRPRLGRSELRWQR